jgi:5-oxoprolinase (ATP-hydrolysing)
MRRAMDDGRWQFWIDRGGTFTDVVARTPDGRFLTHKLLSEHPERYRDAAIQGMRDLLGIVAGEPLPVARIAAVKMGTTVGTNALLERTGERTVLVVNKGFRDALRIGYQNRPRLFELDIRLPEQLYEQVIEVAGRVTAQGEQIEALDEAGARAALAQALAAGARACAIVFMHGYRYHAHEQRIAALAREVGFAQVSTSHETSALMKLVSRGDTTVVDAYLSPILRRYVELVAAQLGDTRLMFMQSSGGLTDARLFQGRDCILSGPAGGVVGAVRTCAQAGFERIIGFDMGGTSTDVSHYAGEFERSFETEVAGVRMRAPMMHIHTVAAGGGSILHYDGARLRVGPDSAGADPGPACYRRGGPLTVTDCNVMLGRLQPAHFPQLFGPRGDQPLDADAVREHFAALASETGHTPQVLAEGFLKIAVENMANAIKKISIQRGHDVSKYVLACFGGAGGQHACAVADALGMTRVYIHPFAGVLSAFGMGLADVSAMREQAVEATLAEALMPRLAAALDALAAQALEELAGQEVHDATVQRRVHVRYAGTDTALVVPYGARADIQSAFERVHRAQFGFVDARKALIVEAISVEAVGGGERALAAPRAVLSAQAQPIAYSEVFLDGAPRRAAVYERDALASGQAIDGPAIVRERTATTVIEAGWRASTDTAGALLLERVQARVSTLAIGTSVDPVMLEIFNNLFMSVAEQMGVVLQKTAHSVNIKERLDFSCAVFDREGELIANAPHIPVHLGAMSESVQATIHKHRATMHSGDVFVLNSPYDGGSHIPDVTIITPVFDEAGRELLFYTASRGHHAEIGGISPGSMPPFSRSVTEEGVLLDNIPIVARGVFLEDAIRAVLSAGPYPSRSVDDNIADLKAQIAACEKGAQELRRMVAQFGLDVVNAYMRHVRDNAEESVRRVLDRLSDGAFEYEMDDGARICVQLTVDRASRSARLDFTGTSAQLPSNYNAPTAVVRAAALYVFRCLVGADIPLNAGCLQPIELIIPEGSMLNPRYPAACVAGNVETSQTITDALFGAVGAVAAAQGTSNNFTFGDARRQYYETICGGAGAGPDFDGASAVHTHMTNTRLTDPEVLEWRFPVILDSFEIRTGSGGRGRHRGGDGIVRRVRFREAISAAILSSHRRVPPFGLAGGEAGEVGRNWIERADGTIEVLAGCDQRAMQPGDVFVISTPSGGGYGPAQ